MILGGQSIPEKVHSDLVHPRDKTKIVLKSLDQMLFKNSLCNTLALICAKQPLPTGYSGGVGGGGSGTKMPKRSLATQTKYRTLRNILNVGAGAEALSLLAVPLELHGVESLGLKDGADQGVHLGLKCYLCCQCCQRQCCQG